MDVRKTREAGAVILEPVGALDSLQAPDFQTNVMAAIAQEQGGLVIDCAGLRFVSSAGLRVFLIAAKALTKADRGFALCGMDPTVADAFRKTGFDAIIDVCDSRADAVAAVAD